MRWYLAGPITGLSYERATGWRRTAEQVLWEEGGIVGLSPMRGKDYLLGSQILNQTYSVPMLTQKAIVGRDRWDIMGCDGVLFNLLDADCASIGTMIEYGWADTFRKLIVTVMNDGNVHDHAFVRELSHFLVPTLDEALDIILSIGRIKGAK